jgi:Transmembrane family, TMEM144 of transporters
VANVYAVKAAGLAVGFGISSSCVVLSSFTWGIFVFAEPVHSKTQACLAMGCLILGLLGMSYYSSNDRNCDATETTTNGGAETLASETLENNVRNDTSAISNLSVTSTGTELITLTKRNRPYTKGQLQPTDDSPNDNEVISLLPDAPATASGGTEWVVLSVLWSHHTVRVPKRQFGMVLAAVFGFWIGSSMVPMKLAPANAQGPRFLISFAAGSALVNAVAWLLRYLYNVFQCRRDSGENRSSWSEAYRALPCLHWQVMWRPGGLSGLLWSIGNFFNLLSVHTLGQGVGYPLVQSSLLVSGLWGIFYFQEVQGRGRISKWILSSLITLCGIVMLGRQHVGE